ncbi:MAG: hypothetical protein COB02_08100 [Candidatus Cloacimonadota bacterium]|nr:MAG: hypothetical protein COB02_08100 [Candidatus Cloacimonadota bacterium]
MKFLLYLLFLGLINNTFSQTMIQIPLENDLSHPNFLIENLKTKSSNKLSQIIQGPISIIDGNNNTFFLLDQIAQKVLHYNEDGALLNAIILKKIDSQYTDFSVLSSNQLILFDSKNRRFSLVFHSSKKVTEFSPKIPEKIKNSPLLFDTFSLSPNKKTLMFQNRFNGYIYTTSTKNLFKKESIQLKKIKNSDQTGLTLLFQKKLGFISWSETGLNQNKIQFSYLNSKRKIKKWFQRDSLENFAGLTPLFINNESFIYSLSEGGESSTILKEIHIIQPFLENISEKIISINNNEVPWYTSRRICSNNKKIYIMSYETKLRSLNIDIISLIK